MPSFKDPLNDTQAHAVKAYVLSCAEESASAALRIGVSALTLRASTKASLPPLRKQTWCSYKVGSCISLSRARGDDRGVDPRTRSEMAAQEFSR
jgi:hypothetical protein